jgi:Sec-independent protein translocase protein TatA
MDYFRNRARIVPAWVVLFCLSLLPQPVRAQEDVIQFFKNALADVNKKLDGALKRIDQLEKEKAATAAKVDRLAEEKSADAARVGEVEKSVLTLRSAPSALNPAIGLVLDATVEHRSKAGGDFNFRSAELGVAASVDPYARVYSFINGSRGGVEVDEAVAVTTSLPWNITAKGGRFLADFGRIPKIHEHEIPFVNEPLSVERMVGGETQADGAEFNYLFPTPFFLRATLGGYRKIGEGNERVGVARPQSWSQFTYLGRLNTYFDLNDNNSLELGSSIAYTPSVRLPGDPSGSNRVLGGIDLTYRYQPLDSAVYQGLTVGAELFGNSERVLLDDAAKRRRALGGFSFAELKLNKTWSTGFLFDYAPSILSPGKKTIGYSPFLTWNISEFNRLRFQFTHADDRVREDKAEGGNQFFLQWTTVIGAHTHGFLSR